MESQYGLDPQQQGALVGALRVAARGEVVAERTRRRLCDEEFFDPWTAFQGLQFCGPGGRRAALGAGDLYAWLRGQPSTVQDLTIDDVLAATAPFEAPGSGHEVQYQGFLRMVLPKDDPSRGLNASRLKARTGEVAPEVAHLLCELLTNEIDVVRSLREHQQRLIDLGVSRAGILKFLNAEDSTYAGDLVSPSAVRRVLVDRFRSLDREQCEALVRRINPTSSCLASFDELGRIVGPLAEKTAARGATHGFGNGPRNGFENSLGTSMGSPMRSSPAAFERSIPTLSGPLGGLPLGGGTGREPSTGRSVSPGPGRLNVSWNPEVSWSPSPPASPPAVRTGVSAAGGLGRSLDAPSVPATWASPPFQDEEPIARWASQPSPQQPRLDASRGLITEPRSPMRSPEASRDWSSPLTGRDWEHRPKEMPWEYQSPAPTKKGVALDPFDLHDAPHSGVSTRASTALLSPRTPLSRRLVADVGSPLPSAGGRSASVPAGLRRELASAHGLSSPHVAAACPPMTARSSPGGAAGGVGADECYAPYSSPGLLTLSPVPRFSPEVRDESRKQRAIQVVLHAVAQQAKIDAQLERAKACLPGGTSIDALFRLLDRFGKGYVAATDLMQFCKDFGSASSFGGLCSLVQEVQLRHPQGCKETSPNRLSLREVGTLLLPYGSREHDEIVDAASDAEALSILYVLRNSEPCPGCSVRVQRDADARGCPSVKCPCCGTSFQCKLAVSDRARFDDPWPVSAQAQFHLFKLLDTAAKGAEEMEKTRKQIALLPDYNVIATLMDAFMAISEGRSNFAMSDLQRALFRQDIFPSEHELGLLWRRYAPRAEKDSRGEATFPAFARHLKPRGSPVHAV